jgi:hypothetical protein
MRKGNIVAEIKSVKIVVEVIVKENDNLFYLSDYEQNGIAAAVEDKLADFCAENYRNDWTILGTQVKKIK